MVSGKKLYRLTIFIGGLFFFISCNSGKTDKTLNADRKPVIVPDYTDVTIPPNIAPMNFKITEEGKDFKVTATSGTGGYKIEIKSADGIIQFPEKKWRKLVRESKDNKITFEVSSSNERKILKQYEPFYMYVAS